jgi:hypothetical protein
MDRDESSAAKPTLPGRRTIARRLCFAAMGSLMAEAAFARPNLGDREWMRRFREFVKTFNGFLEVLNEGKFDVAKWNAIRTAWKEVDVA